MGLDTMVYIPSFIKDSFRHSVVYEGGGFTDSFVGKMSNALTLNQVIPDHCCPLKSPEMYFFRSYLLVRLHSSSQGFLVTLKRLCR
jgi:hypothetical protein